MKGQATGDWAHHCYDCYDGTDGTITGMPPLPMPVTTTANKTYTTRRLRSHRSHCPIVVPMCVCALLQCCSAAPIIVELGVSTAHTILHILQSEMHKRVKPKPPCRRKFWQTPPFSDELKPPLLELETLRQIFRV